MMTAGKIIVGLRGLGVMGLIVTGVMLACPFPLLNARGRHRITRWWSSALLGALGVRLEAHGWPQQAGVRGLMMVSNHISWLDVIVMNAVTPACFVAKSEVRSWPVLGWLCRRVGTLFVRRSVRADTMRVSREIAGMLGRGEHVALFPEGTSSAAGIPGHFHSSLLQGAIDANAAIMPVAIRYHDETGERNDAAAFVGDMSFAKSLWQIVCNPSLHASLYCLPPIVCSGSNRREMAAKAHDAIHLVMAGFSRTHTVYTLPGKGELTREREFINS